MNNAVYYNGECVGFRCFTCDDVFPKMWGTKCDPCRNKASEIVEIVKLRAEIERLVAQLRTEVK